MFQRDMSLPSLGSASRSRQLAELLSQARWHQYVLSECQAVSKLHSAAAARTSNPAGCQNCVFERSVLNYPGSTTAQAVPQFDLQKFHIPVKSRM
jgi:hypothetical protein